MKPNHEFKGTEIGTYYFICTIGGGFHCHIGVKASVIVVEHVHECPFHPYNWILFPINIFWFVFSCLFVQYLTKLANIYFHKIQIKALGAGAGGP